MLHEPRAIITYSVMCPRDSEEAVRFADAFFTWERYFQSGLAVSCPVGTWVRSIQCTRGSVPFLRDLIDFGFTKARPKDVVVFTNSDICLTLHGLEMVMKVAMEVGVAMAARVNFDYESGKIYDHIPETIDGGIDLVAVTRGWWVRHRRAIPDFVIGRHCWDEIFSEIASATTGNRHGVIGAIYHRKHQPYWVENRLTDAGQIHNQLLWNEIRNCSLPASQ